MNFPTGNYFVFDSNKSLVIENIFFASKKLFSEGGLFDIPEHTSKIANETSPNRSSNILPNFFLLSTVVYMSSSF